MFGRHRHQFDGGDGCMVCRVCGEERRYDRPYYEIGWPQAVVILVVMVVVAWPLYWLLDRTDHWGGQ